QIRKVYGDYKQDGDDIEIISGKESRGEDFEDEIDIIIEEEERINIQELINSSDVPPIIRIVNAIISEALRSKASDVHIEPKSDYSLVRYRIDGMLVSKIRIPSELHRAVISRIKIISKMDISERRLPQDGRMTLKAGTRFIDVRVATMPTINGEKVVMRILDKSASIKSLEELGVLADDQVKIKYMLNRPQGMLIATGPTGSGKTTLLYSMLNMMLSSAKNYQTIEDPVEYFLDQANQIFVREKTGLTFPSVLRATLRQDPDVILVGEIRDRETADIAFKAALTGHMVLSSLHTNSSVSSITRLIDMQVKPYLIASALEGIIAQRLVRKICRHCKKEDSPDPEILKLLNIPQDRIPEKVFQGKGCHVCNNTGYAGRTGVFEFFVMNDDFRHFISSDYKEAKLLKMARGAGMTSLMENGVQKVLMGETTLDELLRVIGAQTRHEHQCDNCRKMVETGFLFCPYCGTVKRNLCLNCMIPLEEDWMACPACGKEKAHPNEQ
ncbi:MAG: Flp pilus assembly complex ATPase component TadA, partial [Desulfobulbaceae bacterium]|nr:Flp pilus assembly complex ATPase component TadA [Desulfobulbaceae bacterium]